jgi:hypothetical protein
LEVERLRVYVVTQLQLPMRQLARKGGMSKAEAAAGPKNVSSIADAVKEGILIWLDYYLKIDLEIL